MRGSRHVRGLMAVPPAASPPRADMSAVSHPPLPTPTPAPAARPAARLYLGHVMHMRLAPVRHRFRYPVFTLLVDIDRLDEIAAGSRLFGHNCRSILAVLDRDHGALDGTPLRPWVEARLARAGIARPDRIELLAFPRIFGYVFNPLSVYYCYDGEGRLTGLVYEVKNTWGDQVAYALPAGAPAGGVFRQRQRKTMAVSPFIGMDETYRFDLAVPERRLALRIRQAGPDGETMIATLTGAERTFGDAALAAALARIPLMTLKVTAAIHWQALRLWLKGVPLARAAARERAHV